MKQLWRRFLRWHWHGPGFMVIAGINVSISAVIGIWCLSVGCPLAIGLVFGASAFLILNVTWAIFNRSGRYAD